MFFDPSRKTFSSPGHNYSYSSGPRCSRTPSHPPARRTFANPICCRHIVVSGVRQHAIKYLCTKGRIVLVVPYSLCQFSVLCRIQHASANHSLAHTSSKLQRQARMQDDRACRVRRLQPEADRTRSHRADPLATPVLPGPETAVFGG